ncbi:MAG: pyroglutamyl-peptidase I [Pseudomonadota bacterium]
MNNVVLVTGFEPFGGEVINPSWEIASALPSTILRYRIERIRVPTEFGRSIHVMTRALDQIQPAIVLSLGQAGGRSRLGVERIAINCDDASIADNAGKQPVDKAVAVTGPAAYFSTLPIKAMVLKMAEKNIPAEVSNSAGTFVCNHLMFGVLHYLASNSSKTRAGFMHVPYLPSQVLNLVNTPSMSLADMIAGVEIAIKAAIKYRIDIKLAGGAFN